MAIDVEQKTWLASAVAAALQGYDAAAALLRVPPELRGADPEGPSLEARSRTLLLRSLRRKLRDPGSASAEDAFLGPIDGHIGLVLEIALVHGVPFDRDRREAELASFFAAMTGNLDLARAAQPPRHGAPNAAAVRKALVRAAATLRTRGDPPGDPKGGLALRAGVLCIERRHLARLAMSYYATGHLDVPGARKLYEQSSSDLVLLVEALACVTAAGEPPDARGRRIGLAQVARLGLPREEARDARMAVKTPRGAAELARAAPVRLRAFLLEQMLLSELATGDAAAPDSEPARGGESKGERKRRADAIQAFADEASIPPEQVAALQADATELYTGQQRWLEAGAAANEEWEELAQEWEEVADEMVDKVAAVLSDNLEAIVREIKQTGELGQLVAKAASGKALTADEKRKVKLGLIDLAKAVPALAIFAAPGGMLLLPILAKLLPFSVLPSAWDAKEKPERRPRKE